MTTRTTKSKRARTSQGRSRDVSTSDAQHDDDAYALRIIPVQRSQGLNSRHVAWCDGDCRYAGRGGKGKATMKRSATKEFSILGYVLGFYCDKCAKVMKQAYEDAANNWQPGRESDA